MPVLTAKELMALSDQLDFEKVLCCKYQNAARESGDEQMRTCYAQMAARHKENYTTLLGYLH